MFRFSLLAVFLVWFTGCSTLQVTTDFNPKTDFSEFRTYAWLNDTDKPSEDVRINNILVVKSVRSAVEEVLESKGFAKVEREHADFLVVWFGAIEEKLKTENINHFYRRYGYGTLYRDPYWNSQPTVSSVKEYEEGRLIIDMVNPDDHSLIWRGGGKDKIVEGRTKEQVRKNLGDAVKTILERFPPQ